MEELHYKRVDRESNATQEGSFIETYLLEVFPWTGKTNPSLFRELEPIPKPKRMSLSREHTSLRVWKALNMEFEEDEGFKDEGAETAVSTSTTLSLYDKPVSSSLDLTSTNISQIDRNQSKDWRNKGERSAKTNFKALPLGVKGPIFGQPPLDLRNAPKQVKRKET